MKIIYRKAKLDDFNNFLNLWEKLDKSQTRYHPSYVLDTKNILRKRKKHFKEKLRSKDSFIYVAEYKGKLIGSLMGEVKNFSPIMKIKKMGQLSSIFVEKKYQRKGIGAEFIKILIKEFKKRKLNYIRLEVNAHNSSAISFYRKVGFKDFRFILIRGI